MTPYISARDVASELLTYRELATELGVNRGTLKRWKHEGMPAHLQGERVLFDVNEVRTWIAARRSDPVKLRRLRGCTFSRRAVVYFGVGPDGLYKIGWSSDARRRGGEEDFEVLATLPGDKRIEALFHATFATERVDGSEWFRPSPRLAAFVDGLVQMQTRRAA